jgi:thioredoxin 1
MIKVIKFEASWCGPCKALSPIYGQVKQLNPDVTFTTIDVDQESSKTIEYGVRSVPTIIIEKDGQEVKRITGMTTIPALTSLINSFK